MAKKILCIVLSVTMLLGIFAVAASAGLYYDYTPETAAEEIAAKGWYVDYDADVDWKDEIDRRWLTATKLYDGSAETAAPQEILDGNLYFWADEIIEAYNSAASNEDYWNLYNKMATPMTMDFKYEEDGEEIVETDILYDYAYAYREESKAVMDLTIVPSAEYAKAGDVISVGVYATSNFLTSQFLGGIFYDKQYLKPLEIIFNSEPDPTWIDNGTQLEMAVTYDDDGNVVSDYRELYWPENFQSEENFNKYGVSFGYFGPNIALNVGEYNHGRQFNGELVFTATYEVKADVPEGEKLEFFLPEGCVTSVADLAYAEYGNGEDGAIWTLYRVQYVGLTDAEQALHVDYNALCDQTVKANVATVTIGEEPTPAVKGEIVDVVANDAYIGDTAVVEIDVTGSPEALNVVVGDGAQRFAREDATIETTEAGETWLIELLVSDAEVACSVVADYGDLGETEATDFVLTGLVKQDLSIHSIEIPDMYPDAQNGGVILAGKHDIIIKTSTDVVKIQFYAEDGTTYTYTSWSGAGKVPFEDVDGERVWTINHAFGPYGEQSLVIRTRSESTFFNATGTTLDATVVY